MVGILDSGLRCPSSTPGQDHYVVFFGKTIGHFRDAASLWFKTRPSAKPFLWKLFFYYRANKTNFHNKGFALDLVLRVNVFGTRKWHITCNSHKSLSPPKKLM